MKRILLTVSLLTLLATGAKAYIPTKFTPGYLAVLQECDGGPGRCSPQGVTTGITNYNASDLAMSRQNQIFIDQFDPNGANQTVPSLQVAIPTNGPGAMMVNGNAGTEGNLTLSDDLSVLAFTGYAGDLLSITTGGQTAPSNLNYSRGICTVDAQTNYSQVYLGGGWYGVATGKTNPRGVATDGQGNFWGCGNGYGSLFYTTSTGDQPIQFQNIALTSAIKVINHKLYTTVKNSESVNLYPAGVYSFVDFYNNPVNKPTAASFLHLEIPAQGGNTSCIGFDINPSNNIAYVADSSTGIQKYVKQGLNWTLAYNLKIPGYFGQTNGIMTNSVAGVPQTAGLGTTNVTCGCFSVTVDWSQPNPVVYATTSDSGSDTKSVYYGNRVIRIIDTNTVVSGANLIATTNILTTVVRPPVVAGIQLTNIVYKSVTFTPNLLPVVTTNPVGWSAVSGQTPSFNVAAFSSTGNLGYQWLSNGVAISGQTGSALTLPSVNVAQNNTAYRCIVNNDYGAVTSSIALLNVFSSPQSLSFGAVQNITNYVLGSQSITVTVSGTDAKGGYQWYANGVALTDGGEFSGSTTPTLTINGISIGDAGVYSVSVTNAYSPYTYSNTVANFYTQYAPPVIVQSPAAITTFVGSPVNNVASAYGSLLTEQWYSSYVALYTITNTTTIVYTNTVLKSSAVTNSSTAFALNGYVTNAIADGAKYSGSTSTTLSLLNPQIADTVPVLLSSTLLSTTNTAKTTYTTNAGVVTTTLTLTTNILSNVYSNLLGNFSIVFTNPAGAVTSSPVALTVLVQPNHSFIQYSTAGSVYNQTFNSLPVNGGSSADSANPNTIQTITDFTVLDLTTGGPNNKYSLANPFDFNYPILSQGSIGGLGVSQLSGWYGWSALNASAGGTYGFGATYGDQSAAGIIDFGQNYTGPTVSLAGVTNRALGLISNTKSGYVTFGAAFINNTANTITNINLSFTGELWRNNPSQEVLGFSYAIDPAGTNSVFVPVMDNTADNTVVSINGQTAYAVDNLNVAFPTRTTSSIEDGTRSTNQVAIATNSMAIANWAPGQALWLVWSAQTPVGGAQAVAIDNLSFSSTNIAATVITPLNITPGSIHIAGSGATAAAQFNFTNAPGLSFSVLATNNITAPKTNWPVIGTAVESSAGQYQFTDPNPATNTARFYILRQP